MKLLEKINDLDTVNYAGIAYVPLPTVLKVVEETEIIEPIRMEELKLSPKSVLPGDIFTLDITEEGPGSHYKRTRVYSGEIGRSMIVNKASIFWIEDSLNYRQAICGAFGEDK